MGLLKPIRIDENRRRLPLAGTNQKIWGVTVNGVGARERDRVLTASASSGPSECPCLIRTESCRCSDRQGRFVSEAISAQWLWTFLNRSPMLPAKYKRSKMKAQNMKRMRRPDCRSLAPDIFLLKRWGTDAGRLFEVTTAFQIEDSSVHLLKNGRTLFSCCMNTCLKPFPPVVHFRANAAQGHSSHCPIEHGEVPV